MRQGGYFACRESGAIDRQISGQYEKREEKLRTGEQTIVGLNKYRNEKDKPDFGNVSDVLKERALRSAPVNWELSHNLNKA
jgi:methylmalonyl-CoA mutase N-terminal domain/subunit